MEKTYIFSNITTHIQLGMENYVQFNIAETQRKLQTVHYIEEDMRNSLDLRL